MKASQLRDLTRRYAGGGFARDEYIAERTRLIDGIVAGEVAIKYRELEPSANSRNGASRRRGLVLGGTALLVGMLIVAILAYFLDNGHPPQTAELPISEARPDPGVDLLREFARAGVWSNAELERLEADWRKLSAFQQERTRRTPAYRQLKHETTQRIAEQEALLAAGEMEALLQAARLREFADRLGFITE